MAWNGVANQRFFTTKGYVSCGQCGGLAEELARAGGYVWLGCENCHRSWRERAARRVAPQSQPEFDSPRRSIGHAQLIAFLITVGAVSVAFAVRLVLRPFVGGTSPFLLFTPAIMIAAFYAGPTAGVLATAISAVLGGSFFLRLLGEPAIEAVDRIALFLLVGALITILSAVVERTRRDLRASLWRELKARAEAEAANQAKDDFLALASHELQTPTSVVLGWTAMIRARELRGHDLARALDVIERNANVQSKLVADILDTSRIASGTMRMDRRRVSLTTAVAAAVEGSRPSLESRQLQINVRLAPEDWIVVADPVRLQQVFTNLLANAAKFTPANGSVSVTMARTATEATVRVADTGVGIAAEFLPRVFERFAQNPETLSLSRHGLGLGLSICRHFIEQLGGRITVASDGPGRGSTFEVGLPLAHRDDASDRARAAIPPNALCGVSILLLEDDDDTRGLLAQTLARYGASVEGARCVDEARRALGGGGYDVLLCDLRMAGEDGFAFIQEIRRHPDRRIASLPAASITASPLLQDRDRALAAGYQSHLCKPVDTDELAGVMLALARRAGGDRVH